MLAREPSADVPNRCAQRSRYFSPVCLSLGDLYKVSVLATSVRVKYQLASSSVPIAEPLSISGAQHRACCWESLTLFQDAKYEEERRRSRGGHTTTCLVGAGWSFTSADFTSTDEVTSNIGWHERAVRRITSWCRVPRNLREHVPLMNDGCYGHHCTHVRRRSEGAFSACRIVSRRPCCSIFADAKTHARDPDAPSSLRLRARLQLGDCQPSSTRRKW
jgi:hypothetical protein